jgi:hypothetical protein
MNVTCMFVTELVLKYWFLDTTVDAPGRLMQEQGQQPGRPVGYAGWHRAKGTWTVNLSMRRATISGRRSMPRGRTDSCSVENNSSAASGFARTQQNGSIGCKEPVPGPAVLPFPDAAWTTPEGPAPVQLTAAVLGITCRSVHILADSDYQLPGSSFTTTLLC